jgi:hypothetical protein
MVNALTASAVRGTGTLNVGTLVVFTLGEIEVPILGHKNFPAAAHQTRQHFGTRVTLLCDQRAAVEDFSQR